MDTADFAFTFCIRETLKFALKNIWLTIISFFMKTFPRAISYCAFFFQFFVVFKQEVELIF